MTFKQRKDVEDKGKPNTSNAFAILDGSPADAATNFTDVEIQEFMDGFIGVNEAMLSPHQYIQQLLKRQPQSERVILSALLKTMQNALPTDFHHSFLPQYGLFARLAGTLSLFSDAAIKDSALQIDALGLTPRQIGSLPDLAGALGILGDSHLPVMKAILSGYASRNISAMAVENDDHSQYRSALRGLCAMGLDAKSTLATFDQMSRRDQLFTGRNPIGAATLITLLRLGAPMDHYRSVFTASGWSKEHFDAFLNSTFDRTDCLGFDQRRGFLIRHPRIHTYWPVEIIRENMHTTF